MGNVLPFKQRYDPIDPLTWEVKRFLAVYIYACPTCKVRPGDYCRSASGRRTQPHLLRKARVRP